MATIQISGYNVEVDDEDLEKVISKKWYIRRHDTKYGLYYFVANPSRKGGGNGTIILHRFIMGCERGDRTIIDHIDGNTLNNHKSNLRFVTHQQNMNNIGKHKINTSGYKGVCYSKTKNIYTASINHNGRAISIYESKTDPEECAKMYDMMVIKLKDALAYTNFPRSNYTDDCIEAVYKRFISRMHQRNTSGYYGVSYNVDSSKWVAQLVVNKVHYWGGKHNTSEEAALARDRLAYKLLGDKAKLNFPERIAEYTLTTT